MGWSRSISIAWIRSRGKPDGFEPRLGFMDSNIGLVLMDSNIGLSPPLSIGDNLSIRTRIILKFGTLVFTALLDVSYQLQPDPDSEKIRQYP